MHDMLDTLMTLITYLRQDCFCDDCFELSVKHIYLLLGVFSNISWRLFWSE